MAILPYMHIFAWIAEEACTKKHKNLPEEKLE
jgi:hypothetical protein